MADAMVIQVNGETREATPGSTVTSLLAQLGLPAGRVAVEYNRKILPKAQWDSTHVASGDRLEIVQLVGGG